MASRTMPTDTANTANASAPTCTVALWPVRLKFIASNTAPLAGVPNSDAVATCRGENSVGRASVGTGWTWTAAEVCAALITQA